MSDEEIKKSLKKKVESAVRQYHIKKFQDAKISNEALSDFINGHAIIDFKNKDIGAGNQCVVVLKATKNYLLPVKVKPISVPTENTTKGGVRGGILGGLGGGGAGAGVGALVGIIGGPIGVGIGLAIGTGVGAAVGGATGAASGAGIANLIRSKETCEIADIFLEMGVIMKEKEEHNKNVEDFESKLPNWVAVKVVLDLAAK